MSKTSKLQSDWFAEDRSLYKGEELKAQLEASEKAILASTVVCRRLAAMMQRDIEKTHFTEENFDDPAWERKTIAAAAERKVLRRYLKLLP